MKKEENKEKEKKLTKKKINRKVLIGLFIALFGLGIYLYISTRTVNIQPMNMSIDSIVAPMEEKGLEFQKLENNNIPYTLYSDESQFIALSSDENNNLNGVDYRVVIKNDQLSDNQRDNLHQICSIVLGDENALDKIIDKVLNNQDKNVSENRTIGNTNVSIGYFHENSTLCFYFLDKENM